MFIDPFSEAIKNHDIMDVSISKFRNHSDPSLFDNQVMILNSEITNREDIVNAIEYLENRGVKAIGIDLVFDSLHHNKTDTLLADCLSYPNVILAYTFKEEDSHGGQSESQTDEKSMSAHNDTQAKSNIDVSSHSFFTENAHQAYVNLGSNDGFSVRNFEPFYDIDHHEKPALSVVLANYLDDSVIPDLEKRDHKKEWINFRRFQPGNANHKHPINPSKYTHYPFSSIKNMLKDSASYDANYFKNKVVLIGFSGEDESALSMKDRYFTPLNQKYQGRSLPDMHGVTVHANIISMLVSKDFIDEVSEKILYLVAFFIFFFNYLLFAKIVRRKPYFMVALVRVLQALQFVVLFTLCVVAVTFWNVKIGFILIITAVILSYELFEFYEHKIKNRMAQLVSEKVKSEPIHE